MTRVVDGDSRPTNLRVPLAESKLKFSSFHQQPKFYVTV